MFNHFPSVTLRFFDASALHAGCSQVLVWGTTDMPEYREALEALQAHDFLGKPCFEVVDVIPTLAEDWPALPGAPGSIQALACAF